MCVNLGDPWKEYKTNKMPLGKLILDHKVQEQMSHQLMQIIEEQV
jgi:predicted solute-binding protein